MTYVDNLDKHRIRPSSYNNAKVWIFYVSGLIKPIPFWGVSCVKMGKRKLSALFIYPWMQLPEIEWIKPRKLMNWLPLQGPLTDRSQKN